MSEEKTTKHNVIIRLISPVKITYDQAVFKLASSLDKEVLEDNDLLIVGYDFDDSEWFAERKDNKQKGESKLGSKLGDLAARSPGALGDLFSLLKGYKWHQIYIGFAAAVLGSILLYKWVIRLITGTF